MRAEVVLPVPGGLQADTAGRQCRTALAGGQARASVLAARAVACTAARLQAAGNAHPPLKQNCAGPITGKLAPCALGYLIVHLCRRGEWVRAWQGRCEGGSRCEAEEPLATAGG